MSRKSSSTVCKSKQIPRIFQRRNPSNSCGTVRPLWNVVDGSSSTIAVNGNNQRNATPQFSFDPNDVDVPTPDDERTIEQSTKNWNCQVVNSLGSILTTIDGDNVDENSDAAETVADIEKWLKIRTESVSSIDLDSLKTDSATDCGVEGVGVERYLADDLPHEFLDKHSDVMSLDMDLSDKKLNLDYDPMLQELHGDKLLEACDKNEGFIMPDFQLDHLHPLTLSPEDMMVAGEMLPSAGRPGSEADDAEKNPSLAGIVGANHSATAEAASELADPDIYELAQDFEELGGRTDFEDAEARRLVGDIDAAQLVRLTQTDRKPQREPRAVEGRRTKSRTKPRIIKKRSALAGKLDDNQIILRGEDCNMEGKDGIMAVVAISTDNVSNMTQIVINAGKDEQIYQGKTSALIKATGNFPKLPKIDAPINWTNGADNGAENASTTQHELIISNALAELGITDECLQPMTSNEHGKTWLCPRDDCSREFNKIYALKCHLLAHYGVRPFKCDYEGCAWAFHSEFKLKRHKETHLKRKDFVCAVPGCNRRFTTVYNLWSHEKLHTRPNRITCQVPNCNEKFQTKRALELHMKSHDQSHAPYVCQHDGCGKRYYSSNALTSHQRCHSYKEIDVKCSWPDCGKIFDKPCRLKAHLRSHTGCKPYPCTFQDCHWAFSSSSKLKRHQKKHTNERKFVCNVDGCGKAFMRSEHLKEHSLTHKEGRYFECCMCDARFSAKSSLYVHIKKHQSNENPEFVISNTGKIGKRCAKNRRSSKENNVGGIEEIYENSEIRNNYGVTTISSTGDRCFGKSSKDGGNEISCVMETNEFSYDCDLNDGEKSYDGRTNLRIREASIGVNAIEDGDKSSIETDLDYIFYSGPEKTTNEVSDRTINGVDGTTIDAPPETSTCLPEPEPPPVDETSPYVSFDRYGPSVDFSSSGKSNARRNRGSARTEFTRKDVEKLKIMTKTTDVADVCATDVVLGTGDLTEGLLLTEELPSMYYQDDMVGTECQILLLDSGNSENTINLRGLV